MKFFSDSYTGWMFVRDIFFGIWMWVKMFWPWILAVCILAYLLERLKRKTRK